MDVFTLMITAPSRFTLSPTHPCCPQIFDERDPAMGASMLYSRVSQVVWKDGMHYFNAIDWRQVGHYRVTFRLTSTFSAGPKYEAAVATPPLNYLVAVEDPEWEAELRQAIEVEMEAQLEKEGTEKEKAAGQLPSTAHLSKREK